ncbi:hypothetical protein PO124_22860 [Bacillus licheniformis]|nr:hypothetical protein [Bacillus licheniformis]
MGFDAMIMGWSLATFPDQSNISIRKKLKRTKLCLVSNESLINCWMKLNVEGP